MEKEEYQRYTAEQVFSSKHRTIRGFVEKDYSKPLHLQSFYEINIVLRGSAIHTLGKRTFSVAEGDVFIVPPEIPHGYDGGNGFDVYHILLSPQYLEKYSASLHPLPAFSSLFKIDPLLRAQTSLCPYFRLCAEEIARLSPRLATLTEHSRKDGYVDALICEGEALTVIATLCDIYARHDSGMHTPDAEDPAFLSSIAYLYEHYSERPSIDALAKLAQMSRGSYIAKFKRIMGQPPAHFIRQHRVEMIKLMLRGTRLSEAEIASAAGCTDVSHLIKLFSAETGLTPSAYRKKNFDGE